MLKKPVKWANVYVLINPLNNKIFYIGSTRRGIERRLHGHIAHCYQYGNIGKNKVIRRILKRGKRPVIKSIAKCLVKNQFKREYFYIRNPSKIQLL